MQSSPGCQQHFFNMRFTPSTYLNFFQGIVIRVCETIPAKMTFVASMVVGRLTRSHLQIEQSSIRIRLYRSLPKYRLPPSVWIGRSDRYRAAHTTPEDMPREIYACKQDREPGPAIETLPDRWDSLIV